MPANRPPTTETPAWILVIQLISTVVLVATFGAYLAQILVMQKQIGETLSATKTQNTLTLMQFLMQPEVYDARWSEFAVSMTAQRSSSERESMIWNDGQARRWASGPISSATPTGTV